MSPLSATVAVDEAVAAFAGEVGDEGPVAVEGGRTRWALGGPLREGTRLVRAPAGVLEHLPEEMIVRVRAGTPVAELHEVLAAAGQRSALPERGGTVGGALAAGEDGLAVLSGRRVRDSVLQVRYVSAEGKVVTGGGPTVKNVSGFDLPRIMVGSLGTLGLLAEVILRVDPLPAATAWLAAEGADPWAVLAASYRPAAVLWDGATTWLGLEGHDVDVDAGRAAVEPLADWAQAQGPPALPPMRWSLAPAELRRIDRAATGAYVASIGVGTLWGERPQPPRPLTPGVARLAARVKAAFDPAGRLNPGRTPGRSGAGS